MKYVSTRPIGGKRDSAGVGNIIIPADADKQQYIDNCFRTGTISIALENGGVIDNVIITKAALNEIDFPESPRSLGSQIVWINQPRKNKPIAIGVIHRNNEFVNFTNNKSNLRKSKNGFVAEVIVDAEKGCVVINSNSVNETGGDIHIISTNKSKNSQFKLKVSGDIKIESNNFELENSTKLLFRIKDLDVDDKITEISYEKGVGAVYTDEFGNEFYLNSENIQFKPNSKFNIGDGNEPIVLGTTFKDILDQLSDLIAKISSACAKLTVGTSMGPSTVPVNASEFIQISLDVNQLKEQHKQFLSQVSSTD